LSIAVDTGQRLLAEGQHGRDTAVTHLTTRFWVAGEKLCPGNFNKLKKKKKKKKKKDSKPELFEASIQFLSPTEFLCTKTPHRLISDGYLA
jgi:hypothetical protein